MSKFEIVGGSVKATKNCIIKLGSAPFIKIGMFGGEIPLRNNISYMEKITQGNIKDVDAKLCAGIAGGLLFGTIGALAGVMGSGDETCVTLALQLKTGQNLICVCDLDTYNKIYGIYNTVYTEKQLKPSTYKKAENVLVKIMLGVCIFLLFLIVIVWATR